MILYNKNKTSLGLFGFTQSQLLPLNICQKLGRLETDSAQCSTSQMHEVCPKNFFFHHWLSTVGSLWKTPLSFVQTECSAPLTSDLALSGIGGNLVAIQSSRISTHLHFHCAPGEVPEEAKGCYYPCRTFFGTGVF